MSPFADLPRSMSSFSNYSSNLQSPQPYQELFRPTTITTVTVGKPNKKRRKPRELHERQSKKKPTAMKSQTLTEAEFDALPPSVQRKYFSTLERLRIADGASTTSSGRRTAANSPRPSTSASRTECSWSSNRVEQGDMSRSRSRLRRRPSEREEYALSQVEAQWFMTLPDKIKRQHFSKEEQSLLTKQCETVIFDPADEAFLKTSPFPTNGIGARAGAMSTPPPLSHRSLLSDVGSPSSFERRASDPSAPVLTHPNPDTLPPPQRRPSIKRNYSSKNSIHSQPSPIMFSSPFPTSRPSTQSGRSVSFNGSVQPRRPSISQEARTVFYQDTEVRKKVRLYLGSPQKFDEAIEYGFPSSVQSTEDDIDPLEIPVSEPSPDSRILDTDLQRYLAGTQESLAFLDVSDESSTFFDEEEEDSNTITKLIDEYRDSLVADTSSISDLEGPATPSSEFDGQFEMVGPTPGHYLPSRKPSLASMQLSSASTSTPGSTPVSRRPSTVESIDTMLSTNKPLPPDPLDLTPRARRPYVVDSVERELLLNREMTLRLTLTRPDLRADDEEIYGWQNNVQQSKKSRQLDTDPLALNDLPPFVEDGSGAMGAFAARKKGAVMKVWQLMGRK